VTILPFALAFIFVEILYHLDVLLLRFFQDDQAVGIFSAANRVVLAIIGINLFVHTALLPTFSRLYVESRSELVKISRQSLRLIVLISLPLTMGIFALADRFIIFFFSETFVSSGGVLRLLSWTIAFNFIAAPFSVLLTAINRQTAKVIGIGVCLAFNFILNVVLIPSMSFNGAATAKLLAEALHLVLMAYLVSKYLTLLPVHRIFLKPALSCLLMYIFIRLFSGWHLLYIVLASIVVYSLSLVILRGYSKEEIAFVKHMYQRIVLKGESTKDYDSSR
jgi:O-antigen/teichoic acid export membrane protein